MIRCLIKVFALGWKQKPNRKLVHVESHFLALICSLFRWLYESEHLELKAAAVWVTSEWRWKKARQRAAESLRWMNGCRWSINWVWNDKTIKLQMWAVEAEREEAERRNEREKETLCSVSRAAGLMQRLWLSVTCGQREHPEPCRLLEMLNLWICMCESFTGCHTHSHAHQALHLPSC